MSEVLHCPKCNCPIEIADALSAQVRGELQKQFDSELARRLKLERADLESAAAENAAGKVAVELNDLRSQLTDATTKVKEAQQTELALRKERRELEQQKQSLELEVTRKIDEERQKLREQVLKEAADAAALKEAEKDKLIRTLSDQVGDLKRKIEQGSQQTQGEVLEEELEQLLARYFPEDRICPVVKGVHGGDVVQHVVDSFGRDCGVILWETKRTKRWSDEWLPKLRNDQRNAKAQVAILVSIELPKEVTHFGYRDGIWVCSRLCAYSLAVAMRAGLLEVGKTLASMEGRQEKMDMVYNYLSSVEFKNRVGGIVEAFHTMRIDLETEKRSMQRQWARREKQLDRAVSNTAGLHGDLAGIMGNSLPAIQLLELPSTEINGELASED